MNREPAALVATITGAATAVITLVVAFGLNLTHDQQAAILSVVAVLAPIVAGLIIRGQVFSPASHAEGVAAAIDATTEGPTSA